MRKNKRNLKHQVSLCQSTSKYIFFQNLCDQRTELSHIHVFWLIFFCSSIWISGVWKLCFPNFPISCPFSLLYAKILFIFVSLQIQNDISRTFRLPDIYADWFVCCICSPIFIKIKTLLHWSHIFTSLVFLSAWLVFHGLTWQFQTQLILSIYSDWHSALFSLDITGLYRYNNARLRELQNFVLFSACRLQL